MKYLVSLSDGKDSTACLLWALNTLSKEDVDKHLRPILNVGNENQCVNQYGICE